MRLRESVGLLGSRLELRALFLHELALVHVELGLLEQSDRLQVPLDHVAQLGDGRGHEFAAGLPVAALRIEYRLQLLDQKGGVAALAKYGGNDPGERDAPLVAIQALRGDAHLGRPPRLVRATLVEHDDVYGDVQGVIGYRSLDLVSRADQNLGALEFL